MSDQSADVFGPTKAGDELDRVDARDSLAFLEAQDHSVRGTSATRSPDIASLRLRLEMLPVGATAEHFGRRVTRGSGGFFLVQGVNWPLDAEQAARELLGLRALPPPNCSCQGCEDGAARVPHEAAAVRGA